METTTRLRLKFKDQNDDDRVIAISDVSDEANATDVKALADGLIANNAIFEKKPTEKVSAELITTETSEINIAD